MKLALRGCGVLLQYGQVPHSSINAAAAREAASYGHSRPITAPGEKKVSFQNAMEMELKRRREMVQDTNARFEVIQEARDEQRMGRAIGIDLGTTNSCISYIDLATQKPKIIPSPTGSWVFPTAVTFDQHHNVRLYGEEARACVRTSASATLCSGKRLIGRSLGELGRVQSDMSKTNVLTLNEKGEVAVEIMGRTYTVVHIIAMFLRYLKREAERFLKEPVDMAVVSVPAYFTPQQKVATEDAALSAGFDVLEIIDEPSAACLTYTVLHDNQAQKKTLTPSNSEKKDSEESEATPTPTTTTTPTKKTSARRKRIERSFVFDLGGGTLDCAILEHDRRRHRFTLLATHGDPMLGGNDWDALLSQHFANQFIAKWHVPLEEEDGNIGQGLGSYRALALEAEKAKIHFTHSTEVYHGYNRAFHFSERLRDIVPLEATLTLEEYVALTRPLRLRCLDCVDMLLQRARLQTTDIDHVLLVGAMTRDPPVRHMLEEYFGQHAVRETECPADYAVAIGAAIRAGMLQGAFPELAAHTRFVAGSTQARRSGGWLRRFGASVKSVCLGWPRRNAAAQGIHWRGRAHGLSDDEIAAYAKELVEFEAASERRALLEKAETEANSLMRRVTADANRRQGMQEQRIRQLCDQLKFWQYMVHNFHDHEEELSRTVRDLQRAMDELEGYVDDNTSGLTAQGTVDFSHAVRNALDKKKTATTTTSTVGKDITQDTPVQQTTPTTAQPPAGEKTQVETAKPIPTTQQSSPGPKILRRKPAPLPKQSAEAQELIQAGHPALRNADVTMSDSIRNSFIENQVEERAWHEPPVPPGESGSWREVQRVLAAGGEIGTVVVDDSTPRQPVMHELLAKLNALCPLDPPPSAEYQAKVEEAAMLQTMTIEHGAVDMVAIELALQREEDEVARLSAQQVKAMERTKREEGRSVSERMFGGGGVVTDSSKSSRSDSAG